MKPSYFHFEIPSGRNHGQADVASSYLATITWCAWYPTWRRNVAQRGMCIGIPPPSPLDRCHVVRVFAGGCAWELGYGHRPMSCVHTPCCTHSYAAPPPSYSAVKLLLTFVSFIIHRLLSSTLSSSRLYNVQTIRRKRDVSRRL